MKTKVTKHMKVTRGCAAMVAPGTSLLLLAGIPSSQAAEIKIASPSAYTEREGEGCFCRDSEPPYRYQQVFPAADFAALGSKPHWIVGFGPRADQSVSSPRTAYLPDNYVRLSTTQQGPGNQSPVFDDNFGSDVIQFYSGPLTMVADVAGPGPGPKGFYHADFPAGVTPFLYDPSQGNLLFDFTAWQGESPKILADQIPDLQVVAGNPFATQGGRGSAAIFQFTFVPVPEPGTVSIALIPAGVRLRFAGVAGRSYNIERAPAVTGPWNTINTQTAPVSGFLEYLDTNSPASGAFYRTSTP